MLKTAELKQALKDNAESLALELFGQPVRQIRQQWTWGRKSSTVVTVGGRWRGHFKSWETLEGGSMLDAIMFAHGSEFDDAKEWARNWLGDDPYIRRPVNIQQYPVIDVDAEEIQREKAARKIWQETVPLNGTPAETYLYSRAITSWPDIAVRYHAKSNSLIVGSIAPSGNITAIQRIFLTPDGRAITDEDGSKRKRSFGPIKNGAVHLPGTTEALLLAEGPETGLSAWGATEIETWVGLGAVGNIKLDNVPLDRPIILCRDDDGRNAPSLKNLKRRITQWKREGRTVLSATPHEFSRADKSDFNDVLQESGYHQVSRRIRSVLSPVTQEASKTPVSWARQALQANVSKAVSQLWNESGEEVPPAVGMKVQVGLGKTEAAIEESVKWVNAGHGNVVFAVPTHRLGGEIIERVKSKAGANIQVAIWRGREADDPDTGEKMCRDIETVKSVQNVGGDPQSLVCIKGEKKCPYFDVCGYQKQRQQTGQIWIVAHHALFTQKPEVIPKPSLCIIDETFVSAGMRGISGSPIMVSERQLEKLPNSNFGTMKTADLVADLKPIRDKLLALVKDQDDDQLSRQAVIDAGLTSEECKQAAKREWERKIDVDIYPGMSADERKKKLSAAKENSEIPRMARMWKLLEELIDIDHDRSGTLSIKEESNEGATYRGVRLKWRESIRDGWKAPTLHVDATMEPELIRSYLPNIKILDEIKAATPHQKITQYVDRSFSKYALIRNDSDFIDKVWQWCEHRARVSGGKWLVVIPKDAEEIIREKYDIPEYISLAHHKAISGRDEWKDVRGLIVVGRTLPPTHAVESITGVLTGKFTEVTKAGEFYAQRTVPISDARGRTETIEVDTAGHPIAEAVRRSICEAEITQIIGRARGVNRTEDNPVEIHVLNNLPLEEPIDELAEWKPLTLDEKLFAQKGIWLSSVTDMAAIYGVKRNTLKMSRDRQLFKGTDPYKNYLYGNVPLNRIASYQRNGRGRGKQVAVYNPEIVPDVKSWLEKHLGDLAWVEPTLTKGEVHLTPGITIRGSTDQRIKSPLLYQEVSTPTGLEPATLGVTGLRPSGYEPDGTPDLSPASRRQSTTPRETSDGVLTSEIVVATLDLQRGLGISQAEMAGMIGISRPQLANALQQRFGLGSEARNNLDTLLANPPPVRQSDLFHPLE
jgi:putative DNA primase/helicase